MIDLSEFHDSDLQDPSRMAIHTDIITRTMKAFGTVGFIAIKGHGLSEEQIRHQFSLGKLLLSVSEEEKRALHARIEEGSWAGYKVSGSTRKQKYNLIRVRLASRLLQ